MVDENEKKLREILKKLDVKIDTKKSKREKKDKQSNFNFIDASEQTRMPLKADKNGQVIPIGLFKEIDRKLASMGLIFYTHHRFQKINSVKNVFHNLRIKLFKDQLQDVALDKIRKLLIWSIENYAFLCDTYPSDKLEQDIWNPYIIEKLFTKHTDLLKYIDAQISPVLPKNESMFEDVVEEHNAGNVKWKLTLDDLEE